MKYSQGVYIGEKLSTFSDISQNSILEKRALLKIQYEKNELFTKFFTRITDSSQNSKSEKRTSQNSISEKQTIQKIQYIGMKVSYI